VRDEQPFAAVANDPVGDGQAIGAVTSSTPTPTTRNVPRERFSPVVA
jgi:hypothetical protein